MPSQPEIEASSWGRIKRRSHEKSMPYGGKRVYASEPTYGVVTKAAKKASHEFMGYVYRGIGNVKVHRLVCEAFNGPCPPGMVCIHLDEDSKNNRPENLKWGTQKENLNMPKIKAFHRANCRQKFKGAP